MPRSTYLNRLRQKTGIRIGEMAPALARNDDAFTDWLLANTPEGSTLTETLISIALDVWQEENPNDS